MFAEDTSVARRPQSAHAGGFLHASAARSELCPDRRPFRHQCQRDREAHRERDGSAGAAHAQGAEETMSANSAGSTPQRDPTAAEFAEAAAWLARLRGPNRTESVERGLRRWLDADRAHAAAF